MRLLPTDPEAWYHWAEVQVSLQQPRAAERALRTALSLEPTPALRERIRARLAALRGAAVLRPRP